MDRLVYARWVDGAYCFMRADEPLRVIGIVKKLYPGVWQATNALCKHETRGRTREEAAQKMNSHMH